MADKPVHIEGHALTHDEPVARGELERIVAKQPTVPLRLGNKIVGEAHLSVDDTGLKVTADIRPQGSRILGYEEGAPVTETVHDTMAPFLGQMDVGLSAALNTLEMSICDVSIVANPADEA